MVELFGSTQNIWLIIKKMFKINKKKKILLTKY